VAGKETVMSEANPRRHWTPSKKLQIVLESLQSDSKVAEICRREGISPQLVYKWRSQLLSAAGVVFADRRASRNGVDPRIARLAAENQRMKSVIAEITAENLVLKKVLPE
jgi:transposase